MNKLPRSHLDNTLNAILIAVGLAAVVTLAVDTTPTAPTLAQAPAVQTTAEVAVKPAAGATTPAGQIVASLQAPAAR